MIATKHAKAHRPVMQSLPTIMTTPPMPAREAVEALRRMRKKLLFVPTQNPLP